MREKELKGFRLTAKRQDAIKLAESHGKQFNVEIFKDPITRMMSPEELVEFSDRSMGIIPEVSQNKIIKKELTKEQVRQHVHEIFELMQDMLYLTASGSNNSLFISGSAGVGKTESAKEILNKLGIDYKRISGNITAGGLYTLLHAYKDEDNVILFDDTDCCLSDEKMLNILKAATDSGSERIVDWGSSKQFVDEEGESIPNSFKFDARIIFISNKDLFKEAKHGGRFAPHIQALISRSTVLDVTLNTKEEFLARIWDVMFNKMDNTKYSHEVKVELFDFLEQYGHELQELSLRMIHKVYGLYMNFEAGEWQDKARKVYGKR